MKYKPYSMVRPKKQKQASAKNVKQKIKDIKNQLGKNKIFNFSFILSLFFYFLN